MKNNVAGAWVKSRAFGLACYGLLAGSVLGYVYFEFVRDRGNELNISCFAYRDTNRNGIYDLADRPYADLEVFLVRPNRSEVSAKSNEAGFANFPMAVRSLKAPVRKPGPYTARAVPPAGWKVTSGNGTQTVMFMRQPASPAGIVAEKTFAPVGVAPDLTITGTLKSEAGASARRALRIVSPQGEQTEVRVTEKGGFSFPAEVGEWRIEWNAESGTSVARTVLVKDHPVVIAALDPLNIPPPPKRNPRTVDFDALTVSDTLVEIPNGYAGLNWTNWVATHHKLYGGAGYVNGAISSEYVAYNSSGHPAAVWSDRPFDFDGTYITAAWPGTAKSSVTIKGWRDTRLLYEDRIRVNTAGPMFFVADYREITKVEFSTENYWQIVIDDLHIRTD
ncbi:MAG: hypothetical protein ABIZ49_12610 [Opitutaceae bacterium]